MNDSPVALSRPTRLARLPVERPHAAVSFLRARGGGVMDLIAHFWERLAQTPPLTRPDLHLVAALNPTPEPQPGTETDNKNNICTLENISAGLAGVMLYVPKAYRADVLAADPAVAAGFAHYIQHAGQGSTPENVTDLTGNRTPHAAENGSGNANGGGGGGAVKCAIDFITGEADGIAAMVPLLLPLVHKKAPARQLVNVVMQLPPEIPAAADPQIRPANENDLPALNRWRRLYKEERGILFDADMDAWVETQKVFVLEHDKQIAAVAKFDLELSALIEIGGVYTFPEFRNHGFAHRVMTDLAHRIRTTGKTPTLQVDETNQVARDLYLKMGWKPLGRLARVWLTAG